MHAITIEIIGAGARTAVLFQMGATMSSGCDARMCVAQTAVTSTPPSTASHRSRSSTIRCPLPMAGPRDPLVPLAAPRRKSYARAWYFTLLYTFIKGH